ncbi:energy transducer TonB [Flavobacterium sp. W21_SRS_FM6]|uniref:energy transducer TonB n=1 Tax=Flavobacterium sp. W21_SRS_FM6 TaxID=3240268 RepID=UPI003F936992
MKINASIALLGSLVSLLSLTTFAQNTELSEHIETIINAEPIKRVPPSYPISAAKKGQEGWARVSFVIDKEGNVIDPIIMDSSGLDAFEKESLRAVKRWKYSPALQNGEAIEQCQVSVQLDFMLNGKQGVTRQFLRKYKDVIDAIEAQNLELAAVQLDELEQDKLWNHTESGYFWLADSMYAKHVGDSKRELKSVSRALSSNDDAFKRPTRLYLLNRQTVLFINDTQYANALNSYQKLVKEDEEGTYSASIKPFTDKINELLHSSESMTRELQMGSSGGINHYLSRSSFALQIKDDGVLDEVEVRCANKRSRFTASENSEWRIPEAWGQCTLFVTGSPDTQFNIIELGAYTGEI